MALPDEMEIVLNKDLEQQIAHAMHSRFLLQLVCNMLFLHQLDIKLAHL